MPDLKPLSATASESLSSPTVMKDVLRGKFVQKWFGLVLKKRPVEGTEMTTLP